MDVLKGLHWPLIAGLGALALVRPLIRIVGGQLGVDEPPALAVVVTVVITLVWVAVVGLTRVPRPVLTLVLVGLVYAVLSMLLAAVLSPVLDGRAQGPLANPVAIVPVLLTNAVWGLVAGVLALGVRRARGGPKAG
jgi:predicted neutral ceramidase superfamily lipid hydrolase